MSEKISLPYNTGPENLEKIVDVLGKRSGYSMDESDARTIYGGSMFNPTKRASIELGLINQEDGSLKLTEEGKNFLLDGRKPLRKCILDYKPYRLILEKQLHEETNIITKQDVKDFLAKKFEVSDRVQEGASLFFLKIIGYVGWGEYKIGRKRQTRVELSLDVSEIFDEESKDDEQSVDKNQDNSSNSNIEAPDDGKLVISIRGSKVDQKIEVENEYDWDLAQSVIDSVKKRWEKMEGDNN